MLSSALRRSAVRGLRATTHFSPRVTTTATNTPAAAARAMAGTAQSQTSAVSNATY